jgi:hypothetical protein
LPQNTPDCAEPIGCFLTKYLVRAEWSFFHLLVQVAVLQLRHADVGHSIKNAKNAANRSGAGGHAPFDAALRCG